jgi:hypothetical protein
MSLEKTTVSEASARMQQHHALGVRSIDNLRMLIARKITEAEFTRQQAAIEAELEALAT